MGKQFSFTLLCFFLLSCSQKPDQLRLTGDYLNEEPPGEIARLFAPALVSTSMNEDGGPIFTPDGNEIFWRIGGAPFSTFVYMNRVNSVWSKPETAPFAGQYHDAGLSISPDGKKIFFTSKRPFEGIESASKFHTWITEKVNGVWQAPVPAGSPIDHPDDYYTRVSVSNDGTLIKHSKAADSKGGFDLYVCRYVEGKYSDQENLPGYVNTEANEYAPQISPDGSYILFQSDNRPDSTGAIDIYVTFKMENGTWSRGINLGVAVNTKYVEKWPSITPDGKYLFFTSDRPIEVKYAQYSKRRLTLDEIEALYEFYHTPKQGADAGDIYWIDAFFINNLKNEI